MAHYAEINSNDNVVLRVLVMDTNELIRNGGEYSTGADSWVARNHGPDPLIKEKFNGIYPPTYWKQTSYNTRGGKYFNNNDGSEGDVSKAKRKNYAGIGYTFDSARDAFIPPKPFASWILDEQTCSWNAPVTYPSVTTYGDNVRYFISWDESNLRWIGKDDNQNTFAWSPDTLSWISTGN